MYSKLTRGILENHSGPENNCLVERLNRNLYHSNNLHFDFNATSIRKSGYHDLNSFWSELQAHQNNLNLLSLNIQGITTSFNELEVLISEISNKKLNLPIICLQETHLRSEQMQSYDLDNYCRISSDPSVSSFGGLTTYFRDDIKFKQNITVNSSSLWEAQFFEVIVEGNMKIILGNVYKKCSNYNALGASEFITEFRHSLDGLINSYAEVILCGDWNINLLKLDQYEKYNEFFEMLLCLGFLPSITMPTRVARNSATLIDNMFFQIGKAIGY